MPEVSLSLVNVCGGRIEDEFQALYPALISQLREGQKASVTIQLEFKRATGTDTMFEIKGRVTPKFPPRALASLGQVTGEGKIKVDEPAPKPKVVDMFENKEAK